MGEYLENARISPAEVTAGESTVVVLSLKVSPKGIPPGALLVADCPGQLGASRPQFYYSEQDGFVVVDVSEPGVAWRGGVATPDREKWLWQGDDYKDLAPKPFRPFRLLGLVFPEGVPPGADIDIRLGAGGGGFTPGYTVGTVVPRPGWTYRFLLSLHPSLEAPEALQTLTLEQAVRAREPAVARIFRQAAGRTRLGFYDVFGNPSPVADASDHVAVEDARLAPNAHGVFEVDGPSVRLRPGSRVPLADSAPMRDVFGGYSIFWGDLHTHSAQSSDVKHSERGEMRPADLLAFGRDAACLDFMAVTDHHHVNMGRAMLNEAEWEEMVEAVESANADGDFVAIAGQEYRCARGDAAVLYRDPPAFDEVSNPAVDPIDRLWPALAGRGVLTIPHFHNPGSLPEGDWLYPSDPGLDPVIEVFSCHGRFDVPKHDGMPLAPPLIKALRADRNARHLLLRGFRYGLCCNSDDHKGRPGGNGLTALFARDLSRDGVFEALRRRRCYGTTNARIRLVFAVNGQLMGAEIAGVAAAAFHVHVIGTAKLRCVDVLRNGDLHRRFRPAGPDLDEHWDEPLAGAPAFFQVVVTQQDHEMAFSSPIWIDP